MNFEIDFFYIVFDIIFDFWFMILLGAIRARDTLKAMSFAWLLLAGIRIFLFFSPEPLPSIVIPEPNNTIFFFIAGAVIIGSTGIIKILKRNQEF